MNKIGIDVGGTNTDAVLLKDTQVRHVVKTPTTEDVMGGIRTALQNLLAESETDTSSVDSVMIGTTHYTKTHEWFPIFCYKSRYDCMKRTYARLINIQMSIFKTK